MGKENNYIRGKANNRINDLFRDMFHLGDFEIMINETRSDEEKGVDMVMEIFNSDNRHYGHFLTQNKGTRKPKLTKGRPGIISFPLDLSHVHYYYYELHDPLLFLLCDITTGMLYWYPIQLDTTLEQRIAAQRKSGVKSIILEIDTSRAVTPERLRDILNDIDESRRLQSHKHLKRTDTKVDYKATWLGQDGKSIVEQIITTVNLFDGISVFPVHTIAKIFPFTLHNSSTLQGDTLLTDNPELYLFFQGLQLDKDETTYLLPAGFPVTADTQKEVKHILDIFELHMIYHMEYIGIRPPEFEKPRVCLHYLFTYSSCNCERCTFKHLELYKLDNLLHRTDATATKFEELRRAYTFYLIGDMKSACELYLDLLTRVSFNKEPGIYLVSKYNLMNLKQVLGYNKGDNDLIKRIEELGVLNFEHDEMIMPAHFLDIFNALKNNRFLTNALKTIDTALRSITHIHHSDQLGGSSVNNKATSLVVDFMRAYNFVEFNMLVCNSYKDFEVLVDKTLEAALALHSLRNSASSRYEKFSFGMLTMWIFHADTTQLQFLLKRHNIKKLTIEDPAQVLGTVLEYAQNLCDSVDFIARHIQGANYFLTDKLKKVVSNLLLLLSRLDYDRLMLNKIIGNVLQLCSRIDSRQIFNTVNFGYFIGRNDLDQANLKLIIELAIKHRLTYTNIFTDALQSYSNYLSEAEVDELFFSVVKTEKIDQDFFSNSRNNDIGDVVFLLKKTSDALRQQFTSQLAVYLKERFDSSLFYVCAINDIIVPEQQQLQRFIDGISDYTQKVTGHELFSGKKEQKNYQLNELINLVYKFGISFTPEIRELSKRALGRDYYDWLMDLEGYDYANFNPYWIMEYGTCHYFKAFRESPTLMDQLRISLREDYIHGVAQIYFNDLINADGII